MAFREEERVTGGGGGATSAIDLRFKDPSGAAVDLTGRVNLLPCSIKHDGPCDISHYFKPKLTGAEVDGLKIEEAFFRGRKLQGTTITLPEGFRGYVLEKKKQGEYESLEAVDRDLSCWVSRAEFGNLTYWNHDSLPTQDDPLPRSFHWFSVAQALHKPVSAEELASAPTIHTL